MQVLVMLELTAELGRFVMVKYWNSSETFDLMNKLMLFIGKSPEKLKQRKISDD